MSGNLTIEAAGQIVEVARRFETGYALGEREALAFEKFVASRFAAMVNSRVKRNPDDVPSVAALADEYASYDLGSTRDGSGKVENLRREAAFEVYNALALAQGKPAFPEKPRGKNKDSEKTAWETARDTIIDRVLNSTNANTVAMLQAAIDRRINGGDVSATAGDDIEI